MSAYATYARHAQEQIFAGLNELANAQEQLLNAVKEGRPVASELPTPSEVIENAYGFTGRLLDFQKDYALRLAGVFTPSAASAS